MSINKDLSTVYELALRRFRRIDAVTYQDRQMSLEDRRFNGISGGQWEDEYGELFANKPQLEINKTNLALQRIFSNYRKNRITVDFVSKDGRDADTLATACDGLMRADEQRSNATEAYDNAFEEGTAGGFGAWRLIAEEEDEMDPENEHQVISIEPVFDADTSVFFDLDAKRRDKKDAKYAFLISSMTRDDFHEEYPDEDISSWPKSEKYFLFDWATPDVVYIAEYFIVEDDSYMVYHYQQETSGETRVYTDYDFEIDETLIDELRSQGFYRIKEIKQRRKRIRKYILSGGGILEDCGYVAGNRIPIVPYYGKRYFIQNVERVMGHVRLAKDPQRLLNMQASKLADLSANSVRDKPIFTPEQIAGHEALWSGDTVDNNPFLLVNPITDESGAKIPQGPVGALNSPTVAPATAALIELSGTYLNDMLGGAEKGEQVRANLSDEAIELVQESLDMQTYIFMDNFAQSMKCAGEIWLGMARDIYVEEDRVMKTIDPMGKVSSADFSEQETVDGKLQQKVDLSRANFDVTANVGPASSTRKKAMVRSFLDMAKVATDPQDQKILSSLIMMNMEGEGISDVNDYYRKQLVSIGVIEPTPEEREEMQAMAEQAAQEPPNPQDQYFTSEARKNEAQAVKAQAETARTAAQTEKTRAETAKILSEMENDEREALLRSAETIMQAIQLRRNPNGNSMPN